MIIIEIHLEILEVQSIIHKKTKVFDLQIEYLLKKHYSFTRLCNDTIIDNFVFTISKLTISIDMNDKLKEKYKYKLIVFTMSFSFSKN